jgi:hypothetical protein
LVIAEPPQIIVLQSFDLHARVIIPSGDICAARPRNDSKMMEQLSRIARIYFNLSLKSDEIRLPPGTRRGAMHCGVHTYVGPIQN